MLRASETVGRELTNQFYSISATGAYAPPAITAPGMKEKMKEMVSKGPEVYTQA